MKKYFDRPPSTMGDWLVLAAGTALLFAAVARLPAALMALGGLLALLAPFGWGLVLAYVLDIPTRFFAQKLFGGRRGWAMGASYALFFGVLALLAALVVPQLVQSITAFAGRLAAYEETIRQLLLWVQATFGIDMATAEQLVQTVGRELQGWFASLSRQAAQAAARAAGDAAGAAANAFVALAVSIYLLSGKENLLHAAHTCLRAALPPRAAGSVLAVCTLANRIFSGYLGGQLVDALLVGGETFALMSICAGAGAVPRRGAGHRHPAAGIALESGRICHHHFGSAAGGRQLHCAAHPGRGHRPAGAGCAAGHCGGRCLVWHPGHGAGRAHAGCGSGAAQAGGGGRAGSPRPGRGCPRPGFPAHGHTKLTGYLLQCTPAALTILLIWYKKGRSA